MKKYFPALFFAVFLCVSCVATVGPYGTSVTIAPPLPFVVELADPYYVYGGYYYYYHYDRWYYSQSQNGPWIDLPRDHYPGEVRYKPNRLPDRDRGYERDMRPDRDKGHERDMRYDRDRGSERDMKPDRDRGHEKDMRHDRDRGYEKEMRPERDMKPNIDLRR
ncbi:MAG: hypothetical protein ABFD82_17445 [Syntrophaceae bacterium]